MAKEQKKRPEIDPSRQQFKTTDYNELISKGNTPGADSYVSKRKRIFLFVMIGFVFIGTIVWCVISFNKYKKQEEALSLGNGYYDINGDWKSFDKKKKGDINLKKPELSKKTPEEEIVVPKIEPSSEILNADILSGQFQIGSYIYSLPMSMSDFISSGLVIWDTVANQPKDTNYTVSANTTNKEIIKYDDYTFFEVLTYDTEVVNVLDSTIFSVCQYTESDLWNENSQYVYFPGGLHVELEREPASQIYDVGDGLLHVIEYPTFNQTGQQYCYNGRYDFPWNEHNCIVYSITNDSVDMMTLYKNR